MSGDSRHSRLGCPGADDRRAMATVSGVTDHNTRFAVTLVSALYELGVEHACMTPGSRSTPLVLALADHDGITDWPHHDERSSAFFALGIAATTGRPALVITTSGTAAAEVFPAVVEADAARVPLIVLTADRPPESYDVGAPQTVDQRQMYGRAVRWAHDLEPGSPRVVERPRVAALAARLVAESTGLPAGPVHLNTRFREPLMPEGESAPTNTEAPAIVPALPHVGEVAIRALAARLGARRGLIVAGPTRDGGVSEAAAAFAAASAWPIHADALSGLRYGRHDRRSVLAAGDALAWAGWLDRAPPDVVVRFGAIPTSKPVWRWLEQHRGVEQILLEPAGWRDPTASASTVVRGEPASTLAALAKAVEQRAPTDWLSRWSAADAAALEAIEQTLDAMAFPTEPGVVRVLADALPADSVLWAGSSMPVRDVDTFLGAGDRPLRVMANRGANGIDGFLSTGFGSAATSDRPTYLLAGDLSVLHDLTALATAARLGIDATVVAVNNDGGGIFHFLPQVGHPHFERHFGTPHGLDLAAAARVLGVPAEVVDDEEALSAAVATPPFGPRLLEVRTDRESNVEVHREVTAAVREATAGI